MRLDAGIVCTVHEYLRLRGISDEQVDWEETGKEGLLSMKEYELIQTILALQIGYFCARRLTHSDGSVSDKLYEMIRGNIKLYQETFGKDFIDDNAEKIH